MRALKRAASKQRIVLFVALTCVIGTNHLVMAEPTTQPAQAPTSTAPRTLSEADVAAIVQRLLAEEFQQQLPPQFTGAPNYYPARGTWSRQMAPTYTVSPEPLDPKSIVQQASCVLQLEVNRDFGSGPGGDTSVAAAILNTTLVQDSVAASTLKLTPRQRRAQVLVSAQQSGERFIRLDVLLLKGEVTFDAGAAEEMLWGMCDALRDALEQSAASQRAFLKKRAEENQRDLEMLKQRLAEVRAKLRECRAATAGIGSVYGGELSNTLTSLRSQKQSTESELNRLRGRLRQIEAGSSGGALVSEWEDIVRLREARVEELRRQSRNRNGATQPADAELREAEARLAETMAQLLTAKQAAIEAASRSGRSAELSTLRLQIAETETRLKTLLEQMARLEDPKFVEMMEQIPELQLQENHLRNQISNLNARMDNVAWLAGAPVTWLQVTVLGDSGGRKPKSRPPAQP